MFKKAEELIVTETPCFKGGQGVTRVVDILSKEELQGAGRLFAVSILPPGSSIGYHKHDSDFEVYYILSGEAEVNLDGEIRRLRPGDMTCCADGSSHGISNPGNEELRYIAAILYTR